MAPRISAISDAQLESDPAGDGDYSVKALASDIAAVATIYTLFLVWAAGWDHLLLSCILYAPGAILYVIARRERNLRVFTPAEAVLFGVVVLGAVAGIYGLINGSIQI